MNCDDLIPVPADLLRAIRCDLLLASAELRDYVTKGAQRPTAATTASIIDLLDRDRAELLSYAPYGTEVTR